MLQYFWKKNRQRGFTLIELVVVLAILGILIALAVPRYLGARRSALVSEGDNTLQEMKTLAWAYYMQYGTWAGIDSGNYSVTFGFAAPASACWSFSATGDADSIDMVASGNPTGAPAKCGALGSAGAATITLTLNANGSTQRAQVLP